MFGPFFQILHALISMFWAHPVFLFFAVLVGLSIGGFLLKQQPRIKRNWRDLESIKAEYDPLISLLNEQKMKSYIRQIEGIIDNLIIARNRTEKIKSALQGGNINTANTGPLSEQAKASMGNIRKFLLSFEKQKGDTIALFQNLRIKLLDSSTNQDEISKIMQQVDNVTFLVENLDSEDPFSSKRNDDK